MILAPDGDVQIGAEGGPDPVQQQQRRRAQHLGQINRDPVRVGNRVHQRPRQIHQPAAPQDAVGEFENMQADRVAGRRIVVADKALVLQGPQDIVRGAAMQPRGARDLAGVQRPFRAVQCAQNLGRSDDSPDRLARLANRAGSWQHSPCGRLGSGSPSTPSARRCDDCRVRRLRPLHLCLFKCIDPARGGMIRSNQPAQYKSYVHGRKTA